MCGCILGADSRMASMHDIQVENRAALYNFASIAAAADGIIISRGSLGLDVAPEKMALVQKIAISKCNLLGKPVVITRVVDTMATAPRPTRYPLLACVLLCIEARMGVGGCVWGGGVCLAVVYCCLFCVSALSLTQPHCLCALRYQKSPEGKEITTKRIP